MMNTETKSDTPAKPSRTLPMMSMFWLKSAACSLSSVALSTTSTPGIAVPMARCTVDRSALSSMATATLSKAVSPVTVSRVPTSNCISTAPTVSLFSPKLVVPVKVIGCTPVGVTTS